MSPKLQSVNDNNRDPPSDPSKPFEMTTQPGTDMWEKPPSTHSFSAPVWYYETELSSFKSAHVKVHADWARQYDQGGLCIVIPDAEGRRKWVKAGIEVYNGVRYFSTVVTDEWSDWSLRDPISADKNVATIELRQRDSGELAVYLIDDDGSEIPVRKVNWWINLPKNTRCWVGTYCAKPPTDHNEPLTVKFEDFRVTWIA